MCIRGYGVSHMPREKPNRRAMKTWALIGDLLKRLKPRRTNVQKG